MFFIYFLKDYLPWMGLKSKNKDDFNVLLFIKYK